MCSMLHLGTGAATSTLTTSSPAVLGSRSVAAVTAFRKQVWAFVALAGDYRQLTPWTQRNQNFSTTTHSATGSHSSYFTSYDDGLLQGFTSRTDRNESGGQHFSWHTGSSFASNSSCTHIPSSGRSEAATGADIPQATGATSATISTPLFAETATANIDIASSATDRPHDPNT